MQSGQDEEPNEQPSAPVSATLANGTGTAGQPSPRTARLIGLALDLIIVAAAAAGVGMSLTGPPAAGLLLLLAPLATGLQLLRARVASGPGWRPLGAAATGPRAVGVTAVAVAYALGSGDSWQASAAGLAAFVGLCCLAVEPLVARGSRFTVPVAAHLPGVPEPTREPDLRALAVIAGPVASALGVLLLAARVSAWWWVLAELAAAVPLGLVVVAAARRILEGRRRRTAVPAALARYAPEFLVYTGRPDEASYQVTMWLDYFRRTGLRFAVVTRYHVPARALAKLVDEPVVEARSAADLRGLVPASARAALYVNASARNGELVVDRRLRHAYVGHGDSDKPPSFNPTHALYDEIFTAGPAAALRYPQHGVAIAEDKFRVVGRPQVERITPARGPIGERRPPVVLYAPTWRGHVEESALSSLALGERIVSALLTRGATVIFRSHPFSQAYAEDAAEVARIGALLEADAARTGRPHLWGAAAETERGILDCLNVSDAMITDVSSVVSDYLFSGKPFAMIAVPSSSETFAEEYPVARAAYIVRGDLGDLESQLDAMLGADPLLAQRQAVRSDYLGNFGVEDYASTFVDAIREICLRSEDSTGAPGSGTPGSDTAGSDEPAQATSAIGPASAPRPAPSMLGPGRSVGGALLELAGALMAVAALVIALLDGPGWLVAAAAVLASAELLASSSASVRTPGRWPRLLGFAEAARVALVAAGPVAAAQAGGASMAWLLAAAFLLASLLAEDRIRAGWEGGLVVRNLPDVVHRVAPLVPRGVVPMLGIVLAALVAVFAAVPVPGWLAAAGWLALVGAIVLAGLTGVAVERALRRADDVDHAGETLRAALRTYAPAFVVYTAALGGARSALGPWLPVLARVGRPWLIVARSQAMLDEIDRECRAAGVDVPLLLRPTQRGLEDIVVPSLAVAAYVDDAPRNTHLIERRELTHVRLNLGGAGCHPEHAVYDAVFVPQELTAQRYAAAGVSLPAEKLHPIPDPTSADALDADSEAFLTAFRALLVASDPVSTSPETGRELQS